MKPILLSGHERPVTQVKYNRDGDLLFSVAKDDIVSAWYSDNGERLGTYQGHQGASWSVDVDPTTTFLATGSADETMKLWEVKTGNQLMSWEFGTSVRRVEFSPNGRQLLAVTEKRTGALSTIAVFDIILDVEATQESKPSLLIKWEASKINAAGFSYGSKYIVACHEDGSVTQFDAKTGNPLSKIEAHDKNMAVTDLQWAPDRTYCITASKDKTAKLISVVPRDPSKPEIEVIKTYITDTPLNSAAITPLKDFVFLGGGQAAMDVTTTSSRQGKFEARVYHKIFAEEIGRLKGHFGPLNYIAIHPKGLGYCSCGEDGYMRLHHFDKPYFDFKYEAEKMEVVM